MTKKADFSGWATKTNIRCSDGRTIRKGAFSHCDGMRVPLVWNHRHNDPSEVLGHALLEDRDGDIYAYGFLNDTEKGKEAKELIKHGDIVSLSIYANQLAQSAKTPPCDVTHGTIREVSLVLAGANPGAFIDNVMMHSDDDSFSAEIYVGDKCDLAFAHADEDESEDEETIKDVLDSLNDKQKAAVGVLIEQMVGKPDTKQAVAHSDEDDDEDESDEAENDESEATEEVTEETEDSNESEDETNETENEEETTMKHNVFDTYENERTALSHSDMEQIFKDAKRLGSLRAAMEENLESGVLAHADGDQEYGIADIDFLFPDARTINNQPEFIKRDMDWVAKVINGTHHTPFSRVKSVFADITADEARAKGYIKGNKKKDEVFTLLKRSTDPQTIYKKQKLDRDDIVDITDFDVVAWIKAEMRMMLDEEIARAILISDGRDSSSDDKIQEAHIRPIYNDDDLYTVKVAVAQNDAKALINAVIRSRKQYKGSGNPTFFTTEDWLTEMLMLEDTIGHKLYKTEAELATALRVKEIVTVEAMEGSKIGIKNGESTVQKDFIGVYVNLKDYNIGTNRGGQTTFFDDFDIDYNQQKYLLETRLSGALVRPKSAVSFYLDANAASSGSSSDDDDNGEG